MYLASKLVKKRKIWRENFFLLNVCVFCREKNSESTDGQNVEIGHSVGQKQTFFKGLTSLDSFPTKNVKFEMQCRVTGTC